MVDTVGQTIDADVAVLKAKMAALEAAAVAKEHALVTWVKTNWPHFVTWVSTALMGLKLFGKL